MNFSSRTQIHFVNCARIQIILVH